MIARHKSTSGGALLETMLALFVLMVAMLALSSVQLRALLQGRDALLRAEVIAEALALGEAALLWPEPDAAAQRVEDWERGQQRLAQLAGDGLLEARLCRGAADDLTGRCAQLGTGSFLSLAWRGAAAGEGAARFEYRYALVMEAP